MHETNEPAMERISNNGIDGQTRFGRAECCMERKAGKVADFFSHIFSRHCEKSSAAAKQHRDGSNFSQYLPRLKRVGGPLFCASSHPTAPRSSNTAGSTCALPAAAAGPG